MTVVLAIKCSDGIVMGADTQVTDSGRGMSYPAQKLHSLGDHAAWGGSGARSVLTDLERDFDESSAAILEADDVARALQEHVLPVLRHHYEHYIEEVPGEESAGGPSAYLLAAGFSGEQPWIIELNPHAMVSRYEDIGFHAIGSGAPMAEMVDAVRSEWPADLPLSVRLSCTDWVEGGFDLEQAIAVALRLRARGDVDLIDCSSGGSDPGQRIPAHPGYQVPFAEAIRKRAGIATAAVGLIHSPEMAEEILANGRADLVVLGRALLSDPYWPLHAATVLRHKIAWPIQYERGNIFGAG